MPSKADAYDKPGLLETSECLFDLHLSHIPDVNVRFFHFRILVRVSVIGKIFIDLRQKERCDTHRLIVQT